MIYYLALLTLVTVPATLIAWLLLHSLVSCWRRLGPTRAMTIVSVSTILVMLVMYMVREPLLRVRFGFRWPLAGVSLVLLAFSSYLNALVYHCVPRSMAFGLSEISLDDPGELVTEGVYSRVRHPRFVAMTSAVAAMALLTNYLAVYLLWAAYMITILVITVLEERELTARFGARYTEYAGRVPRFMPHITGQDQSNSVGLWAWVLPAAFLAHMAEEAFAGQGLLGWMAGGGGVRLSMAEFIGLTLAGAVIFCLAVWAARRSKAWLWPLVSGATIFLVNGIWHIAVSAMTQSYIPGLLTGLFLYIPVSGVALLRLRHLMTPWLFTLAAVAGFIIHGVTLWIVLRMPGFQMG